jgi:hypothetical protein
LLIESSLLARVNVDNYDQIQLEIASEIAVVIGAVASEGSLTIRQLLEAGAPSRLLHLVRNLSDQPSTSTTALIVSALRALRNVLISTADMTWGNTWGVGRERHVVGTGLVGPESYGRDRNAQVISPSASRATSLSSTGDAVGKRALGLVFEVSGLVLCCTPHVR